MSRLSEQMAEAYFKTVSNNDKATITIHFWVNGSLEHVIVVWGPKGKILSGQSTHF